MRAKLYKIVLVKTIVICLLACRTFGIIAGTSHDLTPAQDGSQACQFCHTPHKALAGTPLWNHQLSNRIYEIYWSTSLDADVDQPTGSSKLFLSCHDGTVALEATISGGGGKTFMSPGSSNLGTDLSNDHPVSFIYSDDLSSKDPQIRQSSNLPVEFRLDQYDELQCVTCHDPHDDMHGNFLVVSNLRSNLCIKCHNIAGWNNTVHSKSVALVKDASDNYLPQTGYLTVADNGCLGCHQPHSAGGAERLFHFETEEHNCLNCHNGLVAQTNMTEESNKVSGHYVHDYEGIHDLKESIDQSERHVECIDCHNAHAVVNRIAEAPYVSGALTSVSGVTAEGRVINQANPSFHPVTAIGVNQNVPSLIPTLDETSIIYCTDCHNSDLSSQAKGPHGSQYPYLLAQQYETDDDTQESPSVYALCYKCHERESILNDESFSEHKKHIEEQQTPCSVCHDPHGISFSQGDSTSNSNLINFDTSIVFADPNGEIKFEDLGTFRGQCFLVCHEQTHSPEEYNRDVDSGLVP